MQNNQEKIYIGIIAYEKLTAKYLPYFLPSLFVQTYQNFELLIIDNSQEKENENYQYLKNNYPDLEIKWMDGNIGFARAYNLMIEEARQKGGKYFLALNPDMVIAPDFLEKMVIKIEDKKEVGAVVPLIYRWDFENNLKTNIIDSRGVGITREHRFFEIDQGRSDDGLKLESEEVFGFTGAAVLFKMEALGDVAFLNKTGKNEYFDELMFMYKEDCDLSYRLQLTGWKIITVPEAKIYHDRTAVGNGKSLWQIILNRKNKNRQIKRWSFLNHWIIIFKYRDLDFPRSVRTATVWYQVKSLIFVILFEPYLLSELKTLSTLQKEINERRQALKIKINIKNLFLK